MPECSIIIVSYNSHAIMESCMADLLDSDAFPITIMDNASPDGSAQRLAENHPHVNVVALEKNLGYGRAANLGIKKTTTRYAMLLNPDLEATPDLVQQLLDAAHQHRGQAAIFAPAVKQEDFTQSGMHEREWISGSAMLFDLKEMESIGLFDEKIFLFSEENDLCFRVRKAGKRILLSSDILIPHLKGKCCTASPKIEYLKGWHFGWSSAYFHTKHQLLRGGKTPEQMACKYRQKQFFSLNKNKRLKYKARADGTQAFLDGMPAFDANGEPAGSNII